ncbi:MAG: hypothetical protein E7186_01155 [Erysipelotrichaceae bacterium]|nr:hypothetical protein [Erysipelotrichaceae bacterium]
MRKSLKIILVSLLTMMFVLGGCTKPEPKPELPKVENLAVQHETEFGGVYIKMTIDDFNKLGFEYGDSVTVEFSNGYKLEEVPYYNGYYVDAGERLLIAYPGYDYIKAAINYGEDLWERAKLKTSKNESTLWKEANLEEHSTASVYLKEKGKYKDIQEARDIHYSDDRTKFPSDEVFANFRDMEMGSLKPGKVYRSASPCDNQHNRAPYVDALIKEAGVNCILNLADNDVKIEKYISAEGFSSPYFMNLYNIGNVYPIALNMNYLSDEFAQKIAQGFIDISAKEAPYLIHCTEGKDRTGFVCMLIEALAGASYQEIADDYMVTYDNYYRITPEKEPVKYRTILEHNLDAMLQFVVGEGVDIKTAPLAGYAFVYLLNAGMTAEQINKFLRRITE